MNERVVTGLFVEEGPATAAAWAERVAFALAAVEGLETSQLEKVAALANEGNRLAALSLIAWEAQGGAGTTPPRALSRRCAYCGASEIDTKVQDGVELCHPCAGELATEGLVS
jgi:hypothetical protein